MELLVEEAVEVAKPIVEDVSDSVKEKSYYITGIFLQADLRNINERIYPMKVLEEAVEEYRTKYMALNRGYGELGHPDESPGIHLENVCILTQSLVADGSNFIGKAKVMNTPSGKIVKCFIDEGVTLGVSSRGRGEVKNGIVQNGFRLVTAVDVVADPSAPEAFVSALVEGREWVMENNILVEKEMEDMRKSVLKANKAHLAEAKIAAFTEFFRLISANH